MKCLNKAGSKGALKEHNLEIPVLSNRIYSIMEMSNHQYKSETQV